MADTFASFDRRVAGFQKELGDDAMGHALGKMAKDEATKAADADIGDASFSGWTMKSGGPIKLDTAYDIIGPGRILFKPKRQAAGPWTVAEFGRNQAAGPRMVGPRLTKTGKVSKARQKRWNGRTQGKQTASDELATIDKKVTGVVDKQTKAALRKFFG
jgi:hypothetical protein